MSTSPSPPANDRLDALRPARRLTLADQVHDALRDMLLAGELVPNQRLSLRDLAARLQVSMMPVREAVGRLAARGALEVLPNRAIRVPLMPAAAYRDLVDTRILNESRAAALAARNATAGEIAAIRAHAERFDDLVERGDGAAALGANKDLHFALYAASGSPSLCEVIAVLWLKAGPVINLDIGVEERRRRGSAARVSHRALCEALAVRDAEAAARAITDDVREATEFILSRGLLPESEIPEE